MAAAHTTRIKFVQIACVSLFLVGNATFASDKSKVAEIKPSGSSVWTAEKGWKGLVVGKSSLTQARTKLGKLYNTEMVAGTKCYNFKDAKVNIFVDEKTKVISKIWVSGDLKDPAVPKTIKEAMKMFGELGNKGPSGSGGNMYEKPGLAMLSSPGGPPDGIAWMEFSKAK